MMSPSRVRWLTADQVTSMELCQGDRKPQVAIAAGSTKSRSSPRPIEATKDLEMSVSEGKSAARAR